MLLSIAFLSLYARSSAETMRRALGGASLAAATILLVLGATGLYVSLPGLAQELALVFGAGASVALARTRSVASPGILRSRWGALTQAVSPQVRLAPAAAAPAVLPAALAVGNAHDAAERLTSLRQPARPLAALPGPPPQTRRVPARYRVIAIVSVAVLALVLVRISPILSPSDDQLQLRVGDQAVSPVDLRQSVPISPYLFGANVFPESTTLSLDNASGFMSYDPSIYNGLRSGNVGLLRFPGGAWGESHLLSYDQISGFATLLTQTGAAGMIQVRLSGAGNAPGFRSLDERAQLAGSWVDYMDNIHSAKRTGKYSAAPFHPVLLWTVGNEPDLEIDPATGRPYTVADYTNAFIAYSVQMHQNNPTIKVFGPELSRFDGVSAGPEDSNGQLWLETFIRGVAAYEKSHSLPYQLLDGVSFHFYPGAGPQQASTDLMANAERWPYVLDPLRQFIRQSLGRDVPIAITEINSYATKDGPPPQLSALWWADTLGTLMNQQVAYLAFFAAEGVDSPYPLFSSSDLGATSMLRVLQLYSHLQRNLVPLASEREPISVFATQSDSHQTVSLMLINKSNAAQLAQVTSPDHAFGISPWPAVDVSLAPYSATVLTLHRGAGAEAFTFYSLSDGKAAAPALTHTICGQKSDPLAVQVPC
jgi:hypothetical protein